MERDELLAHLRARIAQCRRLTKSTTDAQAAAILSQMADQAEASVRGLEAKTKTEIVIPPEAPPA